MIIGGFFMKKLAIIFIGLGLIILGSLMLFKDAFGQSIEKTAEAVATKHVSTKINDRIAKIGQSVW
jgi:hypothetical protein